MFYCLLLLVCNKVTDITLPSFSKSKRAPNWSNTRIQSTGKTLDCQVIKARDGVQRRCKTIRKLTQKRLYICAIRHALIGRNTTVLFGVVLEEIGCAGA